MKNGRVMLIAVFVVCGLSLPCAAQMVIGPDDNVGIGTSTPSEKLSVVGVVESTDGGFRFPDGTIQNTAAQVMPDNIRSGVVLWDYRTGNTPPPTEVVLTVSPDKMFVLTDILVLPAQASEVDIKVYEDATLKTVLFGPTTTFHFVSGIPFSPGSNVVVSQPHAGNAALGNVIYGITISGYEY